MLNIFGQKMPKQELRNGFPVPSDQAVASPSMGAAAGGAGHSPPQGSPAATISQANKVEGSESQDYLQMLAMRMRWAVSNVFATQFPMRVSHPFKSIGCATNHDGTKVLTFVVTHTDYCVIEDDAEMFPSDNLITKLRVLTP